MKSDFIIKMYLRNKKERAVCIFLYFGYQNGYPHKELKV